MKKKGLVLKRLILIILLMGIFIFFISSRDKATFEIKVWNNIYNENNISMYYGESENPKVKALNDVYRVKELVETENEEMDKVLKVVDIVNRIVEFDDVPNSKKINAFDILEEKARLKKVSQRDMAIITRDLLLTINIKARAGEFKKINNRNGRVLSYYIVEYWSEKYNKWIMIDFRDRGYIEKEGVPSSAIEVITELDKSSIYVGKKESTEYIKDIKGVLDTYMVNIDNSMNMEKSNSYIYYVKDRKYINIKLDDKYLPPTVFTENKELFNRNPDDNEIGIDENAYIILMKKESTEVESEEYIIGAFKDGKIMDKYFIRDSDEAFREVKKYSEIKLVNGNNKIELSMDGENTISFIEVEYNK